MKNLIGATLTKRAREHSLKHLAQTLRMVGMAAHLQHITARHIERYVQIQQAASVSDRTLQNRLSHIRSELRAIGRDKLADSDRLGCAHLGVDGASRAGTHAALTTEHYEHVLELARALHPGFAACLQLQRTLGLRQREAIQAGDSLKRWTSTLEHKGYVHVTEGTRGGKTREATPIAVDRALAAVHSAIEAAAENGGDLIPSTSLQGAVRAYGRLCAAVGMTGEHASDALRYNYAQDRFTDHLRTGCNRREALALTSMDLGCGNSRKTHVSQIHLRNTLGA